MARKKPSDEEDEQIDLERREEMVWEERGEESVEQFVKRLENVDEPDPVESKINDAYLETVKIHGTEYAPFLFTKGMPLDRDENGTRYPEGIVSHDTKMNRYRSPVRLQSAIEAEGNFERGGSRPFIGVSGVYSIGLQGMESWRGIMPEAPHPTGPINAMEMIDLYVMEQLRDVPFTDWPNEFRSDGSRAPPVEDCDDSADQSLLERTVCALKEDFADAEKADLDWWYSPDRLFVENPGGTLEDPDGSLQSWGPYVSQFLLHDVEMWALPTEQRYLRYESGVDFNQYLEDWLNTLEGQDEIWAEGNPKLPSSDNRGYIATPRHLATIVNAEPPYQEYFIAALRLLGIVDFDPALEYAVPYDDGEIDIKIFDYTDGGPVGLFDMLTRVCRQALLTAFFQKYYVHFRCRPETYGGRLQAQITNRYDFEIDDLLTDSEVLKARDHETNYLSTAYEEGSPVHPAYPSGHSVLAGACGTVLKTWFDDVDWPEDDLEYFVPDHEGDGVGTGLEGIDVPEGHNGIAQEIDKLASNVGLARMFAGVHYYTDHYHGVKLGEQVAVGVMADAIDRSFMTTDDSKPTFSPYLEYDKSYQVTDETLDRLRKEADDRGAEFLKQ